MTAGELYRAGRLQDAIDAQVKEVKARPADPSQRLLLFTLLGFAGEWDRARKQLDAVTFGDVAVDANVQLYGPVLDAELLRRRLWTDGTRPQMLADPPGHVKLRLDALDCLRAGQAEEAARLVAEANAQLPGLKGLCNERPFTSFRDVDDLFAGVLEVFSKGHYVWVPLEEVAALAMNPPKAPRDLLWIPARLEVKSGTSGEVFLPALYPQSHAHANEAIRLGQETDWKEANGLVLGQGQRIYQVGDEAVAILEWRQLAFT